MSSWPHHPIVMNTSQASCSCLQACFPCVLWQSSNPNGVTTTPSHFSALVPDILDYPNPIPPLFPFRDPLPGQTKSCYHDNTALTSFLAQTSAFSYPSRSACIPDLLQRSLCSSCLHSDLCALKITLVLGGSQDLPTCADGIMLRFCHEHNTALGKTYPLIKKQHGKATTQKPNTKEKIALSRLRLTDKGLRKTTSIREDFAVFKFHNNCFIIGYSNNICQHGIFCLHVHSNKISGHHCL
jgi:hypothetical protein